MEKIYSASFKAFQIAATFLDRVVNDSRLADPHFEGDPYPEYDRLLKKAPLVRSFATGGWLWRWDSMRLRMRSKIHASASMFAIAQLSAASRA